MVYLRQFIAFVKDLIQSRRLILDLTKNDFKKKYLGSFLGIFWAFIQPTLTILIFWFVFQVGFKSAPVQDFPFVLWLVTGLIPWFFFSEGLNNATGSVVENSYLVSKVVFRVSILPLIKVLSALVIHIFFILFLIVMFFMYGYHPTIYFIQIFYYLAATLILVVGISWITSSLVVFLRDMSQIVAVIIQFGFWGTPIFWSIKTIPEKYISIIKLNPVYYIVEGYRNTFIYNRWFWQDIHLTIYFWIITLIIFIGGAFVFRRLRPHFADVL